VPRGALGVLVQEAVGLKREELSSGAQHVMASDGVDAGDLNVAGVHSAPDEVEGLWLAENGALVGSAVLASATNKSASQARTLGVIDSV